MEKLRVLLDEQMEELDQKQEERVVKQKEKAEKQKEMDNFELDPYDLETDYCEMLDDSYPELFNMSPSYILRKADPTAYRVGLVDYVDGIPFDESPAYKELSDTVAMLESEIDDLDDEILELEAEIEELENKIEEGEE